MGQSTPGDMFRGSLLGVSSGLIPRPNCTVASPSAGEDDLDDSCDSSWAGPSSQGHVQSARYPLPIGATHAAHFAGCGYISAAQRLPPSTHPSIHGLASPCTATCPPVYPALQQFATTHQTTIAGRTRGPPPFRAGAPRSTPLATVVHVTHRSLLLTSTCPHVLHTFIRAYTCMHTSSPMSG
ncbi:hypothetical protein COCSADRAFT_230832 [Bipolaris sorokiniana ND90Pr]|uniref:Uncharacterized protein n=1 Tax=Cochliobolus sativus (strain ND90Pr / ATCC 201652) TaxID=665912 RepID=M2SG25_COCSN|nr:uncharacterized protein COCSADRAFT_230832 [Bipolaris sorokiniana ND90Pr]EMD61390.1 hypothetical protein COCSADRAFT_230832 [Bipolaris sorokiniana ND90Pr]